jgi:hypothetical protein
MSRCLVILFPGVLSRFPYSHLLPFISVLLVCLMMLPLALTVRHRMLGWSKKAVKESGCGTVWAFASRDWGKPQVARPRFEPGTRRLRVTVVNPWAPHTSYVTCSFRCSAVEFRCLPCLIAAYYRRLPQQGWVQHSDWGWWQSQDCGILCRESCWGFGGLCQRDSSDQCASQSHWSCTGTYIIARRIFVHRE